MNLDILGSELVPVAVTSENVFDDGRCWIWTRGLESKLGSGWFDGAQSAAFERRGWSDSRAFVSEELKRGFNLIRVCFEGRMNVGLVFLLPLPHPNPCRRRYRHPHVHVDIQTSFSI